MVDLRAKFDPEHEEDTEKTRIIVVDVENGGSAVQMGILGDTVSEVLDIGGEGIEGAPSFGTGMDTDEEPERKAEGREQDSQEEIQQLEQGMDELENHLKQRTQVLHRTNALIDDLNREKQQLESQVAYLERSRINLSKIHHSLKGIQDQVRKRESVLMAEVSGCG